MGQSHIACMCTCMYVRMCTCTHAYMHTCAHVRMYAFAHVHMYTCVHAYMCTCTHVCMCTYVHIYTHMHIQARRKLCESGRAPEPYGCCNLPFMIVVYKALSDNVLLRFGKKSGRVITPTTLPRWFLSPDIHSWSYTNSTHSDSSLCTPASYASYHVHSVMHVFSCTP